MMTVMWRWFILVLLMGPASAVDVGALFSARDETVARTVQLAAPLTTVMRCRDPLPAIADGARRLRARIVVPRDAPADLGVGVFATDRHGRWFQALLPGQLKAGECIIDVALDQGLIAEPGRAALTTADAAELYRAGIFFWSASNSRALITVPVLLVESGARTPPAISGELTALTRSASTVNTGERWSLNVTPVPFPTNPYDDREFSLDAEITRPDGVIERVPGFCATPMQCADRGDRDVVTPIGPPAFRVRYRPRVPGVHQVRLLARWHEGEPLTVRVPALHVSGQAWDGYVRVDRDDSRFFSVDGSFYWPLGPNLRSVWDRRGQEVFHTKLTPDRITFAYDAYLARLAASGGNAVEVWLSSWNLAMEWRGDWPGYGGIGRFNQENAWRLDQVLDAAWARGIRVNVVLQNHGQTSLRADTEWEHNPWNRARGGPLARPEDFYHDPEALAGQQRQRRYLLARIADHPAVLGWKLSSEVNLTEGGNEAPWHQQAAAAIQALDLYQHPVTTHWAGNYQVTNGEVTRLAEIGYVTIDAYHGEDQGIAELLRASTLARDGLARLKKPVLVTEFGGDWSGTSPARLAAEHAIGPWAALVSGHGGAPMLWWFEWIDQHDAWQPYTALSRFLAGEDLRTHADAPALAIDLRADTAGLWAKAWSRPGHLLGYVLDAAWSRGGTARLREGVNLTLGANVAAGAMTIAWWDADTGVERERRELNHPGGMLAVSTPTFSRHLAFKVTRSAPAERVVP